MDKVSEKTRYKANISGNIYTIIGNETKEHMDLTTKLVDEQLKTLVRLVPGTTKEQAAILTAINAVSDQLKKETRLMEMEKELETMADEAGTTLQDVKKYYEDENAREYLKENIKERKLYDILIAENTIKTGKTEKYLDLISNNG